MYLIYQGIVEIDHHVQSQVLAFPSSFCEGTLPFCVEKKRGQTESNQDDVCKKRWGILLCEAKKKGESSWGEERVWSEAEKEEERFQC